MITDGLTLELFNNGQGVRILSLFLRNDKVPFTTTSGSPFPGLTRSFRSFSQAAAENGDSRIYAGIHFRSAVEDGIKQDKHIGAFVFTHALRSLNRDDDDDIDD